MEQIHCPAPLPEEPAGPLLTKMLVPAPYKAPKKEASKKTRGGLRHREASNAKSEDSSDDPSSEDEEEEVEEDEPHSDGGRKRTTSTSLEAGSPKREKNSLPGAYPHVCR